MFTKLKFWFSKKPFKYNTNTGVGHAYISYDIVGDIIKTRTSQFGYITGHRYLLRNDWLKLEDGKS